MTSIYGPMILERKSRIWDLWRQGRLMSFLIAADIEKPPATVFSICFITAGSNLARNPVAQMHCRSMSENSYRVVWLAGTA
jgi:hypothetical protein